MISLQKSITTIEQLEALRKATAEAYEGTLEDMIRFSIELKPEMTRSHKEVMDAVRSRLTSADTASALTGVREQLGAELAEYQKLGRQTFDELRENVASVSRMLEQVTSSMGDDVAAQTEGIDNQVAVLSSLVRSNDLNEIRQRLGDVIIRLGRTVDEIKRRQQLLIVQFQDEIRLLHSRLKTYESAANNSRPARTGATVASTGPFSLMAVRITNWERSVRGLPEPLKVEAFEAFCLLVSRTLGGIQEMTRREKDVVMVRVPLSPSDSTEVSKRLASAALEHSIRFDGKLHTIAYRVRTGVVHARAGESSDKLMARFDQLAEALRG